MKLFKNLLDGNAFKKYLQLILTIYLKKIPKKIR